MMDYKIHFNGRAHLYTDEEIKVVIDAMQGGPTLTQGKNLAEFQNKFQEKMNAKYAFAVNNATAALELSAQLCCFDQGDEVIIPSHTYTATAYPFLKKNAQIVWADIDAQTRVVTAETIAKCMTSKTKAIIVVHLYGYGADMPAIMALAKKHNVLVIEDTAQALGVHIDGKMAGTYGDFGVFSFHSHKNISTLGEGGMLIVKDKKYADIIPMLRHNGHCAYEGERQDYWKPAMGNVDLPMLNGKVLIPNNYCLGEVECALGTKLLDRLDAMNDEKRSRALYMINAFKNYPELEFHMIDNQRHNYHLLVAKVANGLRDKFMRSMAYDHKIQCVVQYRPLHRYDLYIKSGLEKADCPVTDEFFDNMVSFPFNHTLNQENLDDIIMAAKATLEVIR